MKSLQNKLTTIEMPSDNGAVPHAEYADLISLAIKAGKQSGFDYNDIENRIAINKVVNAVKGKTGEEDKPMEFEDAHYNYLVELIKNTKWTFWHEDILKFKDDLLAVK